MPNVITITGPSAAGKSTIARFLLGHGDKTFKPQLLPKYTTRPRRLDDSGEVICVDAIPPQCDLVYEHYEHLYGLELESLVDALDAGFSPIIILNDVQTVKKVRDTLGETVRSVFVFREGPSLDRYQDFAKSVGLVDEKEPVRRFLYAQAFYHVYGQNTYLFDHVIVNGGTFADLEAQVRQLVEALLASQNPSAPRRGPALRQRLFVVVDPLGSAKEELIAAIDSLGSHQARVIPRDAIYTVGDAQECFRASKVLESLQEGVFPVLIVDDVHAVGRLRETFGEFMVLLYVHSEAHAEAYQRSVAHRSGDLASAEQEIVQYREAFDVYLDRFLTFDHVIIDADNPVYLLDQLFWLFRAYERGDLPRTAPKPQIRLEGSGDVRARSPEKACGGAARQDAPKPPELVPGAPQTAC
jgi:guanylate kinase